MAEERYKSRYANGLAVDDALDKGVSAYNDVGDLDDLTTTDNSDIVSAINEVNESVGTLATDTTQLKDQLKEDLTKATNRLHKLDGIYYVKWEHGGAGVDNEGQFLEDSDTRLVNGELLTDYVVKANEVAKEYKSRCIDFYYSVGFNKLNRLTFYQDTTHQNEKGRKILAGKLTEELF